MILENECPKCGTPKPIRFEFCYKCKRLTEGLPLGKKKRWMDPDNQAYRRWFAKINAPLCRSAPNPQIDGLADEFPEFANCRCKDCVDIGAPA